MHPASTHRLLLWEAENVIWSCRCNAARLLYGNNVRQALWKRVERLSKPQEVRSRMDNNDFRSIRDGLVSERLHKIVSFVDERAQTCSSCAYLLVRIRSWCLLSTSRQRRLLVYFLRHCGMAWSNFRRQKLSTTSLVSIHLQPAVDLLTGIIGQSLLNRKISGRASGPGRASTLRVRWVSSDAILLLAHGNAWSLAWHGNWGQRARAHIHEIHACAKARRHCTGFTYIAGRLHVFFYACVRVRNLKLPLNESYQFKKG